MISRVFYLTILLCLFTVTVAAAPPDNTSTVPLPAGTLIMDNSTFIDANKILMFITNHGNFGRDFGGIFGYGYGTFYPFIGTEYLQGGFLGGHSPLYGAGLWMGGKYENETRVVISEYSSEWVPGPMEGGTFMPDCPEFRVYKLYADSLESNPNQDYLNWPVDQGAPLDEYGDPLFRGDQTLWTVFNDADPNAHTNDAGETQPLGVEVRMLTWASDEDGLETIPTTDELMVTQFGTTEVEATVTVIDPWQLTGHDYLIVIDTNETLGPVWHLKDQTDGGIMILQDALPGVPQTVLGMEILVDILTGGRFASFEVVNNAGGVLDPPEPGALWFVDFPVPTEYDPDGWISDRQQATGDGRWAFHTADNGGTGVGTRCCYDDFLSRATRDGANLPAIGAYDYEMRFTGTYDDPGVNGSYAIELFGLDPDNVIWVPFELWQTGIGTPGDFTDDVRLFFYIIDDGDDDTYNLESYGTSLDGTCNANCEHSASGSYDDPFTDWIYWIRPVDASPGTGGYDAAVADMLDGTFRANINDHDGEEILARTVLINWNGGQVPPFTQDCPEQGTVFRITTVKEQPYDTFSFTATLLPSVTTGPAGQYVYLEYWIHNNGGRMLEDCYISVWADPDLGYAGDDYVGCDTMNNIFFCYNSDNDDSQYGSPPPAMGFKYLVGPIVPYPGQTANLHGVAWSNHKDIGMTAFSKFINGTDPDGPFETYGYMQGLTKSGDPYTYDSKILTYMESGDPVAGTGDLDAFPADRRMMGSSGPFDFPPGDSAYVLLRMGVRHGENYLDAITRLKELLNLPYDITTDVPGSSPDELPKTFAVRQNYPNPFNPETIIEYSLPERANVTVDVYNILGQKVIRLVDEEQAAGVYQVMWNGMDESGEAVSTGLYFYRVKAGDKIDNKKMLLLK